MKSNLESRKLVAQLKKSGQNTPIWKRVAKDLEQPTRNYPSVNIQKINKHIKDGETALIIGKVLSVGNLEKKTTVAAFQFSQAAKEKINKRGEAISIKQLLAKNPKGNKVRIIQ
jgi:large subunit ribosomal protein L18e